MKWSNILSFGRNMAMSAWGF